MNNDQEIGLDVGAGCRRTARFIREEILSRFDNPVLAELEDAAIVKTDSSRIAVSTDSYIVDPPVFPGGDIGRLAVCGTVNDLVASGAVPRYLTLGLVMSANVPWAVLRRALDSAADTAAATGVAVVAGDTKVVPGSSRLGLCINTTGIGTPQQTGRSYALRHARPGDSIIITGTIGDHSLAVLSAREGLGFESRVYSDCAPLNSLILPVLERNGEVRALRDLTRGGLRGALCDVADAAGVDIDLDYDAIPVRTDVRAGCEMLGLEPCDMVNEGKMVIFVGARDLGSTLEMLTEHPLGRDSALIGLVREQSGPGPQVRARRSGTPTFVLSPHEGQPIPRLC